MRSARTAGRLAASLALAGALALPGLSRAEGFDAKHPRGNARSMAQGVGRDPGPGARPAEPGRSPAATQAARIPDVVPGLVGAALVTGGTVLASQGGSGSSRPPSTASVPELDPGLAGGAAVLLAGGALLLRARRRRG